MLPRKKDRFFLFFTFLIISLIILNILIYFYPFKIKNDKDYNNINTSAINSNDSLLTRDLGKNPNSIFWKSWGKELKINNVNHSLTFKLKFPKKDNILQAKIKKIIAETVPGSSFKNKKSRVAIIFFDNGIRVIQSNFTKNEIPSTNYKELMKSPYKEQLKKEFIRVVIDGVEGIAGPPGPYINSNGLTEVKPGIVTWYKKPILYTVYGNGKIPLSKLIKFARLF